MNERSSRRPTRVQTKLTVGPADDRYEREADRVARDVVTRIAATSSRAAVANEPGAGHAGVDEVLQAKPVSRSATPIGLEGGEVDTSTATRIDSARGSGRSLDDGVRRSMEGAFGADFSRVRLHQGGESDRLNAQLGARAFTTGSDVFMRSGEYQPGSRSGQELLAHELTHVVQQGGAAELDAN